MNSEKPLDPDIEFCQAIRPLALEAIFGSPSPRERRQWEAHRSTCEQCAGAARHLEETLATAAERRRPEPPAGFWASYEQQLWARLSAEDREAASDSRADRRSLLPGGAVLPRWTLRLAAAVLLVGAGVLLGRLYAPRPAAEEPRHLGAEEPLPVPKPLADSLLTREEAEAENPSDRPRGPSEAEPSPPERRVDHVDQRPRLIGGLDSLRAHLDYPAEARREGLQGAVTVQFIVDREGNVVDPTILEGAGLSPALNAAALEAVRNVSFRPALQNGAPVATSVYLPVRFSLAPEAP